eukprot:4168351-Prymnesium_polylepis.1
MDTTGRVAGECVHASSFSSGAPSCCLSGAALEPAPFTLPHGRCDWSRMTLDGVGDGWWVTKKSASATRRQLLAAGGWRSALRREAAFKCEVPFADKKASIGGPAPLHPMTAAACKGGDDCVAAGRALYRRWWHVDRASPPRAARPRSRARAACLSSSRRRTPLPRETCVPAPRTDVTDL